LRARDCVIEAFRQYFKRNGHLQAFPMIAEMYGINKCHGLSSEEAVKMEMATSLAMLSSGANTAFWFVFQIFSDVDALHTVREELLAVTSVSQTNLTHAPDTRVLRLDRISSACPNFVALLNETFRYHSTVINIKKVKHDTILDKKFLLKKNGIVMIPGQSLHHNKDTWGPDADTFKHERFLSPGSKKNLGNTSAFRPFGAGISMCPGRHFSTNVILGLVAMVVLQYEILPLEGKWIAPTKRSADLWNAMPKPDWDISVQLVKRSENTNTQWRFLWGEES